MRVFRLISKRKQRLDKENERRHEQNQGQERQDYVDECDQGAWILVCLMMAAVPPALILYARFKLCHPLLLVLDQPRPYAQKPIAMKLQLT